MEKEVAMCRSWYTLMIGISYSIIAMNTQQNTPIAGACYFVIHTKDGSTMYRALHQTIYPAPDFYQITIKNADKQHNWHAALPLSGPFVSFHDQATYLVEDGIRRDSKPFEKIELWRNLLDPRAKILSYKAVVYTMQHKIKTYDHRNEPIMEVPIDYDENMLDRDFKDVIKAYVDCSCLEKFDYNTTTKDIMDEADFIQSYKPNNNLFSKKNALQMSRREQSDEHRNCIVM